MNLSRGAYVLIFLVLTTILLFAIYFLYLPKKPKFIINEGDSVITQLKTLNRYETSTFTIEKILDAGTTGNAFQEILFGDKILLVAHGEVIAGFDFANLKTDDIKVNNESIELTLPPPQILVSRLDNEKTRVYDRRQGFLTQGDKDLESTVRNEAEKSIRQAACDGGILEKASENAKNQLSTLIKSLDYTVVTINIPRGNCE